MTMCIVCTPAFPRNAFHKYRHAKHSFHFNCDLSYLNKLKRRQRAVCVTLTKRLVMEKMLQEEDTHSKKREKKIPRTDLFIHANDKVLELKSKQ